MEGDVARINSALKTLGLPPLIDDGDIGEPMTRRQAAIYIPGFFGVYALGFVVLALMAYHGRF
jgi:hypothetical protein